jgi:hypothetical protein
MHGAGFLVGDEGEGHIAGNGLFDTKTFAMNRHEAIPELHSVLFKQMRFNAEFTAVTPRRRATTKRTPTINHGRAAFIENKRYRTKRRPVDGVVNRNAVSVYQTD